MRTCRDRHLLRHSLWIAANMPFSAEFEMSRLVSCVEKTYLSDVGYTWKILVIIERRNTWALEEHLIFSERELCRRPSVCLSSLVCLSSVTFVRPTQAIEIFNNVSMPCGTLAIRDLCIKVLRRSSQGNPFVGAVKHKRGSRMDLSNATYDRMLAAYYDRMQGVYDRMRPAYDRVQGVDAGKRTFR